MRPDSYNAEPPPIRCGNCRHSRLVAYKLDLLCFHGDSIEVTGKCGYPIEADCVELDGMEVGLLEGDEYGQVWADRIVDSDGVCDMHESMPEGSQ